MQRQTVLFLPISPPLPWSIHHHSSSTISEEPPSWFPCFHIWSHTAYSWHSCWEDPVETKSHYVPLQLKISQKTSSHTQNRSWKPYSDLQDPLSPGFLHASELISYHLPSLCFNHTDSLLYLKPDKHTHLSYPMKVWFHETLVLAMMCALVRIEVYIDFLLQVIVSKNTWPKHSPESYCSCWWRVEISICFNILWSYLSHIYIVAYQKQKWKKNNNNHNLSISIPETWDSS